MIGLQKVQKTSSIQVYSIGKLTADDLALHFESIDGVDVANVDLHASDDYAVVHFADSTGKLVFAFTFVQNFTWYFIMLSLEHFNLKCSRIESRFLEWP